VCVCVPLCSLFASLLRKYTRVSHKIASSSLSSSSSAAANHHDNDSSICVVDGLDDTDLVCMPIIVVGW